jgi:uncharacterized protein YgbK (DUF1537 family)
MGLRYAFYGDDFTGASDTLATVAQSGLRALLFPGVPDRQRLASAGALDVLGIAGTSRALVPDAMREELAPAGRFLASLAVPVLHYKCCSTFDSAPEIGNLAVALRLLVAESTPRLMPIVGGQPSLGRYCFMGNLFAAASDGEVYRIDRHPTMSRHPVTPMHESDLRRHLAAQGLERIDLVDVRTLDAGDEAIDARLAQLQGKNEAVLFDATDAGHLARIGRVLCREATHGTVVALGASSVAQALILHWRAAGELPPEAAAPRVPAATTPVFALAGSQSPVTARQIELARAHYKVVPLDTRRLVADPSANDLYATTCAAALRSGRSVLAHTGAVQDGGPAGNDVARACGRLLARVLELAPDVRRVGVAGGDTSSLSVGALDVWGLSFVGALGPGVGLVRAHADERRFDGLELLLKGGQMGPPEIFELLLAGRREHAHGEHPAGIEN